MILRPDDVWIAITTSFARYMEVHAEDLRSKFVDHEGQKELVAYGGGTIMSANWPDLVD